MISFIFFSACSAILCAFARLIENAPISMKALVHWQQVSDWQVHEIRR